MLQKQRTILIIDDCPEDREVYRRYLGQDSTYIYQILEAEEGANGLALGKQMQPDAILLDFLLPDMDGLEFLTELQAQMGTTQLPVVMLTGQGNEAIAVAAMKSGAQDYLVKGQTTAQSLRLAVRNVIERAHLERQLEASEQRFRASVENMLDCFAIYKSLRDQSGKIVDFIVEYVNSAACNCNHLSAEAQIGKRLCQLLPVHEERELFDAYCQVVETGNPLEKETFIYSEVNGKQYLNRAYDIRATKLEDGLVVTWRDISDRKRSEERLRLLESVVVNTNDAVLITEIIPLEEPGPRIIYANEAFTRMTGYSLEEIVGRSPRFLQGPNTNRATLAKISVALQAKQPIREELINYHKNGSQFWVEMTITPVRDRAGEYTHFVSIQRDITERKRTEAKLQESQQFVQQLADTSPGLFYLFDVIEGRNIYINSQTTELLGYTPEQVLAMGAEFTPQMMHPDDLAQLSAHIEKLHAAKQGEILGHEYRMQHANGEWRWFYSRDTVFNRTANGLPKQILGTALDITERKQAEEAIRLQANLLDVVQQAVITTDLEGKILYWNQFAQKLYGWSSAEAIGRNILDIIPAEISKELATEIMSRLQMGESWSGEFLVQRKDGTNFPAMVTDSPIHNEKGELIGIIGISCDITERKRTEIALRRSNERFELAANAVKCLIYDWDYATNIVERSGCVTELLGFAPEEMEPTRQWWKERIHPEDLERLQHPVVSTLTHQDRFAIEYRVRHKDGRYLHILDQGMIMRNRSGQPLRVVGSTIDITERKQAEADLRRANERFELATQAVNSLIYDWDLRTNAVTRTEALTRIFGYSVEEAEPTADWWRNLVHPDDLQQAIEDAVPLLTEGGCGGCEYRVRHKNNQYRWVLDQGIVLHDESGQPIRVVGSTTDITERKQAEAEIQRLNQELERRVNELQIQARVLENMAEGVVMVNDNGIIVYTNPAFDGMFGYEPGELPGSLVSILNDYSPEENIRVAHEMIETLKTQGSWFGELANRRKDGSSFITKTCASALDIGDKIHLIAVQEDISDRKQAEQEKTQLIASLQESEERFRFLAEAIPQIVWTADREGRTDYTNPQFCQYTGLTTEQTLGLGWLTALHSDDVQLAREKWLEALQNATLYEIEYRLKRGSDGTYRWFLVRGVPLKDQQGRPVKWFGTCTDINDQKQLEAERARLLELEQAARAAAEAANRAKDDFVAIVSHDLRAPLNSILGWAQLLRTRKFSEDAVARALETIERNAKSQAQLLEDLLDVSRMIQGKLQIHPCAIELIPMIETAIDTAYPPAHAKGIRLESSLASDIGKISGDPNRLQQVLANLLSNSIKFTPEGGMIKVLLERVKGGDKEEVSYAQITVTDTGQGINPEFLPYVFDRFRQSGSGSKKGGLGLGLAIARHLIELHGGTIQADSPGIGEGATFTIKLPLLA